MFKMALCYLAYFMGYDFFVVVVPLCSSFHTVYLKYNLVLVVPQFLFFIESCLIHLYVNLFFF